MIPFFAEQSVLKKRLGLVQRMRQMVYSSKDFNLVDFCRDSAKYASLMTFAAPKVESLWFLYQAEGLPKNISVEEFLDEPSGKPITAQSMEFLDKPSDQRSSGLSYFRQVVQEDA